MPFGPARPNGALKSQSYPCSASVGTSGHFLLRLLFSSTSRRRSTDATIGDQAGDSTFTMTCPPRTAAIASPPPLPGTCVNVVDYLRATSSIAMELIVDGP